MGRKEAKSRMAVKNFIVICVRQMSFRCFFAAINLISIVNVPKTIGNMYNKCRHNNGVRNIFDTLASLELLYISYCCCNRLNICNCAIISAVTYIW